MGSVPILVLDQPEVELSLMLDLAGVSHPIVILQSIASPVTTHMFGSLSLSFSGAKQLDHSTHCLNSAGFVASAEKIQDCTLHTSWVWLAWVWLEVFFFLVYLPYLRIFTEEA